MRVINGRSGKPFARQRLIVFGGNDAKEVRFQKYAYEVKTDDKGLATLVVNDPSVKRIQVWADFQHLCQSNPNLRSFDIREIISTGIKTPNDCGSVSAKTEPGSLTVFARPRTKREVMDQ